MTGAKDFIAVPATTIAVRRSFGGRSECLGFFMSCYLCVCFCNALHTEALHISGGPMDYELPTFFHSSRRSEATLSKPSAACCLRRCVLPGRASCSICNMSTQAPFFIKLNQSLNQAVAESATPSSAGLSI